MFKLYLINKLAFGSNINVGEIQSIQMDIKEVDWTTEVV